MKVHEAVMEVMRAVKVVRKEDRNAAQNFNFRGIDAVVSAVGPALREQGVVVFPSVVEHHAETIAVGQRGTQMRSVVLLVDFTFLGPEGDTFTARVPGEAMDSGDKAYSKAMSVAFRTALLQTLSLPTDEKDPDADSYERSPERDKTPIEAARDLLLEKVTKLGLTPGEVAAQYLGEVGTTISEETNPARITDFMNRLGE